MTESIQNIQQLKQNVFSKQDPEKQRMSGPMKLGLFVLLVATVVIVISSIISVFTPEQVKITPSPEFGVNVDGTKTQLTTIRFGGQEPTLPQQLPVTRRAQDISSQNIQKAMIEQFQLQPHPVVKNFWLNDTTSLQLDQDTDTFTLTDGTAATGELPIIQRDEAITAAQTLLQALFPQLSLRPISNKITFLELEDHYEETSAEEANGMNIPFTQYIGEYPVFNQKDSQFPFLVTIDGNYKVVKIVFSTTIRTFQQANETVPTIGLEQAFTNIKNANATIISAGYIEEEVNLASLDSAEFATVDIEYREDTGQSIAYPFYRLSGTGFTKDQKQIAIEVITPAVQISPR